jgi:gluconolactonase
VHRTTILPDPLVAIDQLTVFGDGMDHPEGVTVGPDGAVYAGGEQGQVYRLPGPGRPPELVGTSPGGFTLGLVHDASGRVYTCDARRRAVMRFAPGLEPEPYAWRTDDDPIAGCNHAAFDSRGNLYVSDSGHWPVADGRILRAAPGGGVAEVWCEALRTLPNGVCLGPGESHLYVAMSFGPGRIDRVEIRPDGRAGAVETYVELPGAVPDGLAFDLVGDLYIATYRPDAILIVRAADRRIELLCEDLDGAILASPTNVAFGVVDEQPTLFVANIGRWHVAAVPVAVPGMPLSYPAIP